MASKEARALVAKNIEEYQSILNQLSNPLSVHHQEPEIKARQKMIEFVDAFEQTFVQLDQEKKQMIKMMYWGNERKNCQVVGMKLYVDGSTVGRWRNLILNEVAERMGLR